MYIFDSEALFTKSVNFLKTLRGLGACPKKIFLESISLELQKMPLCLVGKYVFIIDLHSGMENMIATLNLCAHFKKLKTLIFKKENISWESTQANAKRVEKLQRGKF